MNAICMEKRVGAGISDPKDMSMNLPLYGLLLAFTNFSFNMDIFLSVSPYINYMIFFIFLSS